jgi:hypothetical protein
VELEEDVEKLAINANKKGWGHLFMRTDDGKPYGEFIAKRPYPTFFWDAVDGWIAGYKAAQPKKYTEEDFKKGLSEAFKASQEGYNITADEIIQSIKPKIESIELEMEFILQALPKDREKPVTYQKDGRTFLKVKSIQYSE